MIKYKIDWLDKDSTIISSVDEVKVDGLLDLIEWMNDYILEIPEGAISLAIEIIE